jgi:hypothetical protein
MLYTFLLQHKKTTCIRQVSGETLQDALQKWVPTLELDVNGQPQTFGVEESKSALDLEEVKTEVSECKLVLLRTHQNVWCTHMRFKDKDALLTAVATAVNEDALAFPQE